jgi:hypothetical protein
VRVLSWRRTSRRTLSQASDDSSGPGRRYPAVRSTKGATMTKGISSTGCEDCGAALALALLLVAGIQRTSQAVPPTQDVNVANTPSVHCAQLAGGAPCRRHFQANAIASFGTRLERRHSRPSRCSIRQAPRHRVTCTCSPR